MKIYLLPLLLFLLSATCVQAEVYKCTNQYGEISFSGTPCHDPAVKEEVKNYERYASTADSAVVEQSEEFNYILGILQKDKKTKFLTNAERNFFRDELDRVQQGAYIRLSAVQKDRRRDLLAQMRESDKQRFPPLQIIDKIIALYGDTSAEIAVPLSAANKQPPLPKNHPASKNSIPQANKNTAPPPFSTTITCHMKNRQQIFNPTSGTALQSGVCSNNPKQEVECIFRQTDNGRPLGWECNGLEYTKATSGNSFEQAVNAACGCAGGHRNQASSAANENQNKEKRQSYISGVSSPLPKPPKPPAGGFSVK